MKTEDLKLAKDFVNKMGPQTRSFVVMSLDFEGGFQLVYSGNPPDFSFMEKGLGTELGRKFFPEAEITKVIDD